MRSKIIFIIFIFFVGSFICSAKTDSNKELLNDISNSLFYNYDEAIFRLDLLKDALSESDKLTYQPYLDYCDGFVFFQQNEYDKAFSLANKSLFAFINNQDDDWEAKCLLLIGFIAEKMRLTDEALEAYQEAVLVAKSNQVLGLAYLGLARSQKRENLAWQNSLNQGLNQLSLTKSKELDLYSRQVVFWFYPDSILLPTVCEDIAKEYELLNFNEKAAASYKLIALYYLKCHNEALSDSFINRSLNSLYLISNHPSVSLASTYFVKGKIHYALGENKESYSCFKKSTELYDSINQDQQNFHIYRYLMKQDTLEHNYKSALFYSNKALNSYYKLSNLKTQWARNIKIVLEERLLLRKELLFYKRRNVKRIALLVSLLVALFAFVYFCLYRKKKMLEQNLVTVKALMKDSLFEVKKKQFSKYLKMSKSEIESKAEKHLLEKRDLVLNVKENSVNILLEIERKMPLLTEREKKCTCLILLGCTNKDLEEILCVKADTIKTYRSRIRSKLKITNPKVDFRTEVLRILKND